MAETPAADSYEPLIEFVENLRMVPPDAKLSAAVQQDSGEELLVEAGALVQSAIARSDVDSQPHSLSDQLQHLLCDENLLRRISARQLYSLFSLTGALNASTKQRFLQEVARRRETDPSNYHLRLLADELRG